MDLHDLITEMIQEKVDDIERLNSEIKIIAEDGEDEYFLEKIRYKTTLINEAHTERTILEKLLDRYKNG